MTMFYKRQMGIAATVVFACMCLMAGCTDKKCGENSDSDPVQKSSEDTEKELNELYILYASGDFDKARSSVDKAISIIKKNTQMGERQRAVYLWVEYARMCSIEHHAGNKTSEYVACQKAIYWQLRAVETEKGVSEADTEAMFEEIRQMTPPKIVHAILELDKENTEGTGPYYLILAKKRDADLDGGLTDGGTKPTAQPDVRRE